MSLRRTTNRPLGARQPPESFKDITRYKSLSAKSQKAKKGPVVEPNEYHKENIHPQTIEKTLQSSECDKKITQPAQSELPTTDLGVSKSRTTSIHHSSLAPSLYSKSSIHSPSKVPNRYELFIDQQVPVPSLKMHEEQKDQHTLLKKISKDRCQEQRHHNDEDLSFRSNEDGGLKRHMSVHSNDSDIYSNFSMETAVTQATTLTNISSFDNSTNGQSHSSMSEKKTRITSLSSNSSSLYTHENDIEEEKVIEEDLEEDTGSSKDKNSIENLHLEFINAISLERQPKKPIDNDPPFHIHADAGVDLNQPVNASLESKNSSQPTFSASHKVTTDNTPTERRPLSDDDFTNPENDNSMSPCVTKSTTASQKKCNDNICNSPENNTPFTVIAPNNQRIRPCKPTSIWGVPTALQTGAPGALSHDFDPSLNQVERFLTTGASIIDDLSEGNHQHFKNPLNSSYYEDEYLSFVHESEEDESSDINNDEDSNTTVSSITSNESDKENRATNTNARQASSAEQTSNNPGGEGRNRSQTTTADSYKLVTLDSYLPVSEMKNGNKESKDETNKSDAKKAIVVDISGSIDEKTNNDCEKKSSSSSLPYTNKNNAAVSGNQPDIPTKAKSKQRNQNGSKISSQPSPFKSSSQQLHPTTTTTTSSPSKIPNKNKNKSVHEAKPVSPSNDLQIKTTTKSLLKTNSNMNSYQSCSNNKQINNSNNADPAVMQAPHYRQYQQQNTQASRNTRPLPSILTHHNHSSSYSNNNDYSNHNHDHQQYINTGYNNQDQQYRPIPTPPPRHGSSAKIVCTLCNYAIESNERVVRTNGLTLHVNCFRCHQCHMQLEHSQFYFHKNEASQQEEINSNSNSTTSTTAPGYLYCHLDYHELFSPRCGYCHTPIEGTAIFALNRHWHQDHFFCADCNRAFEEAEDYFIVQNGQASKKKNTSNNNNEEKENGLEEECVAWCKDCHAKKTAVRCWKCRHEIRTGEACIEALDRSWCSTCFSCEECMQPFTTNEFILRTDGTLVCLPCEARRIRSDVWR